MLETCLTFGWEWMIDVATLRPSELDSFPTIVGLRSSPVHQDGFWPSSVSNQSLGCDGFLFDAGISLNPLLSFQGPEAGRADAAVQSGSRGPAEAPDGRWQSSSPVLRQSRELIPAFPDKIDRLCHYLKRKYMGDIFGMVPMISALFVEQW